MATVPAPARTTPASRYDAQIAAQLTKAERRVRALDLAVGLLSFLAVSLGFALVMVLLHWKLQFSTTSRQVALVVYLLGAGAFLTWKVFLPLRRPINPRFAALQLERTLSGAKNSVVNYVDLRDEELPAAIRGALGRRAAKDAGQANVEQAISGKNVRRAGGVAAAVAVLGLVLMFVVGFGDFFRLLGNILLPLRPAEAQQVARVNRVKVRQPEGGDATVAAGSAIAFAVHVEGELPPGEERAPKLLLTYPEKDSLVRRLVKPRNAGGDWTAVVSAQEARNGFRYRVTAGDAESEEYRVEVFSNPDITEFRAVYTYPVYVGEPHFKVEVNNRRLQAWKGTEVALRVHTNDVVREARIEVPGKNNARQLIDATIAADDPEVFEARFVLEESGTYRLRFTSKRGGTYTDTISYEVIADPDKPPHKVELTQPGVDTLHLPANGLLKVEGSAEDDIGVKSLSLCLKVVDGKKVVEDGKQLKPKSYRTDEELRLPATEAQQKRGGHGGYLKKLAYKDVVDLKTVQGEDGKPVALAEGMVLEYWLEARDACPDVRPDPQYGKTRTYKIVLTEPEKDPQQQKQDRDDARKEQKEHEAKQDQERQQEGQKRQEEQKKAEEKKEEGGKDKSRADETKEKPGKPEEKKSTEGDPQPKKSDEAQQNEKNKRDKEAEENERRGEEADKGEGNKPRDKEKANEKADPKGAGKSDKPNPGESKPADPKQAGDKGENKPGDDNKGGAKPEPKKGEQQKAGESKEGKGPGDGKQPEGKEAGKNDPMMGGQKGEGKDGSPSGADPNKGPEKPGEAKNDPTPKPPDNAAKSAEGKGGDPKKGDGQAAKGKSGGDEKSQAQAHPEGKEAGSDGKVADNHPPGDAKDQQPGQKGGPQQAKGKDEGGKAGMGNEGQSSAKGDGTGGTGDKHDQGETKPGPGQSPDQKQATARGKDEKKSGDAGGDLSKIDAKKPSLDDLKDLMKALKNGDEKQVGKALDKLEEIGEKSEDPNAKEFAKKLTDDLKKFVQDTKDDQLKKTGDASSTPPDPQRRPDARPEEKIAESKSGPGEEKKQTGTPKEGQGEQTVKRGTEKGQGRKDTPRDPMPPPDGDGEKPDPTQPTVKGLKNPLGRNDDRTTDARAPEDDPKPGKPINPLTQPNTALQLEKFDRSKYLDQQDRAVAAAKPHKDPTPDPSTDPKEKLDPLTGGPLKSTTGRIGDPKAPTSTESIDSARTQPPSPWRKAVLDYTKRRAQPEGDKKDPK